IPRGSYEIEHLMPQSWARHWALTEGVSESERDARVHRLGILTLLTKKLNSSVSNGPWLGEGGKTGHLQEKDVVLLNSRLLAEYASRQWDEVGIDQRTERIIDTLIQVWPVPAGHRVDVAREQVETATVNVEVSDLL